MPNICYMMEMMKNTCRGEHSRSEACECGKCRVEYKQQTLPTTMHNANMRMNPEKTTREELTKETLKTTELELLGNYLETSLEITTRIRNSRAALSACNLIFLKSTQVSQKAKVMLYNSLVKPHLMYNVLALPMTQTERDRMNAAHRAELRKTIANYYPNLLHSEELYERTKQRPLEVDITKQRWTFLGHILRRDEDLPANKMMRLYGADTTEEGDRREKRLGCRAASLPKIILEEMHWLGEEELQAFEIPVHAAQELPLQQLRTMAADREQWKHLCELITTKAYEKWTERYRRTKERQRVRLEQEENEEARNMANEELEVAMAILSLADFE